MSASELSAFLGVLGFDFRLLGEGAALFEAASGHTHVVRPAALAVLETVFAVAGPRRVSADEARSILSSQLEVDPAEVVVADALARFVRLGILSG